jgi:spore maturation protein CgeB
LRTPVNALLQCTDPEIFFPESNPEVPYENLLFVGNSRKQYREVVRLAVEAKMPIGVYGTHWPMFIPAGHIRGEYIDNSMLRHYYGRCDVLLNDHWPTMRERGFISNRLFDAAAAGAFVISDAVEGGGEVFGEDLVTYHSEAEFREKVEYYLARPQERRARAERLRSRVLSAHTFASRAEVLLARIKEIDKRKRGTEELRVRRPENLAAKETIAAKI